VTLVDSGDTPELRRLVSEELIDGDRVEAQPRERRGAGPPQVVQVPRDERADSVAAAAAASARVSTIAASRRALALEKPEIEVLPAVLKTKSQISPLPPLLSLLRASDRAGNTACAGHDK
jgi:hypothetical protein